MPVREIILMISFVCIVIIGQAQPDERLSRPKSYLDVAIGASIPLGDYASTNAGNTGAAGAKTGLGLNVGYGYLFGAQRIAGISAHAGFHFHPIEDQTFSIPVGGFYFNGEIKNGPYLNFPLTVGFLISIPVKNNAISFFAEGGTTIAISPKVEVEMGVDNLKIHPKVTPGIAFTTGLAPRFYLSDNLAISPMVQYSYFKTTFTDVKTEISLSGGSNVQYNDIEVKSHILFAGVGVTINLAPAGAADLQKPIPPSKM